jgi:hypothetical protein
MTMPQTRHILFQLYQRNIRIGIDTDTKLLSKGYIETTQTRHAKASHPAKLEQGLAIKGATRSRHGL